MRRKTIDLMLFQTRKQNNIQFNDKSSDSVTEGFYSSYSVFNDFNDKENIQDNIQQNCQHNKRIQTFDIKIKGLIRDRNQQENDYKDKYQIAQNQLQNKRNQRLQNKQQIKQLTEADILEMGYMVKMNDLTNSQKRIFEGQKAKNNQKNKKSKIFQKSITGKQNKKTKIEKSINQQTNQDMQIEAIMNDYYKNIKQNQRNNKSCGVGKNQCCQIM